MTKKTFLEAQSSVESAYIKVAEANMNAVATEVRKVDGGQVTTDEVVNTKYPPMGHSRSEDFLREMGSLRLLQIPLVNASIIALNRKLAKHVPIGKARLVQSLRNFEEYTNVHSTIPSLRG